MSKWAPPRSCSDALGVPGQRKERRVCKPGPQGILTLSSIPTPVSESQDKQGKLVGPWKETSVSACQTPSISGTGVMVEIKIGSQEGKGQNHYSTDGLDNQD